MTSACRARSGGAPGSRRVADLVLVRLVVRLVALRARARTSCRAGRAEADDLDDHGLVHLVAATRARSACGGSREPTRRRRRRLAAARRLTTGAALGSASAQRFAALGSGSVSTAGATSRLRCLALMQARVARAESVASSSCACRENEVVFLSDLKRRCEGFSSSRGRSVERSRRSLAFITIDSSHEELGSRSAACAAASRNASRASSSGTPAISYITRPGLTTAAHPSTRALAATHADFERLLGDRAVREDADPELAGALHVALDRHTGRLDLTRR